MVKEESFEKKLLKKLVLERTIHTMGGYENSYSDEPEEFEEGGQFDLSVEDIMHVVYDDIINAPGKHVPLNSGICLEKKHIRFFGKETLKEMIRQCIRTEYKKYADEFNFPLRDV